MLDAPVRRMHLERVERCLQPEEHACRPPGDLGDDSAGSMTARAGGARAIEHFAPLPGLAVAIQQCVRNRQITLRGDGGEELEIALEATVHCAETDIRCDLEPSATAGRDRTTQLHQLLARRERTRNRPS